MRRLMLAITLSALPFSAQAGTPLVVFASANTLPDATVICNGFKNSPECRDPMSSARRLEYEVQDKMATNLHCAGVTVVRGWYSKYDSGTGDTYRAAEAKDHWDLLLGFEPESTKYDWTLVGWSHGEHEHDRTLGGEGNPAQIAEDVCVAVTGQGANIQ